MKIFVSFRYTGADQQSLAALMPIVRDSLVSQHIETYCPFFFEEAYRKQNFTTRQVFDEVFRELSTCDCVVVILNSNEKSEGMLIEIGYAIAKGIPIVLAKHTDVKQTYLPQLIPTMITWSSLDDLADALRRFEFPKR